MTMEAFVYGYAFGIISALVGMIIGGKARPLVGKEPKPVRWSDVKWILIYGLPMGIWCAVTM